MEKFKDNSIKEKLPAIVKKSEFINVFFYFLISILYLELIVKHRVSNNIINGDLLYLLIFSIPVVIILTTISKLFNKKINKVVTSILLLGICFFYGFHYFFYKILSIPFSFSTIGLVNQAIDFSNIVIDELSRSWYMIFILFLPFIIFLFINKKVNCERIYKKDIINFLIIFMISSLLSYLCLLPQDNRNLYYHTDDSVAIINKFGIATYSRVDMTRQIKGYQTILMPEEPMAKMEDNRIWI